MPIAPLPRLVALLLFASLCFAGSAVAQEEEEPATDGDEEQRMALAREYLELTGFRESAKLATDSTIFQMRRGGQLSMAFIAEYQSLIDLDLLAEETAKVYANAYDAEQLQAAIDFFKTPLGQAFAEKMPQVSFASGLVGRRLGEQWSAVANARVQQRGRN